MPSCTICTLSAFLKKNAGQASNSSMNLWCVVVLLIKVSSIFMISMDRVIARGPKGGDDSMISTEGDGNPISKQLYVFIFIQAFLSILFFPSYPTPLHSVFHLFVLVIIIISISLSLASLNIPLMSLRLKSRAGRMICQSELFKQGWMDDEYCSGFRSTLYWWSATQS